MLLSFTERPTHYTQLYFANYEQISKQVTVGQPVRLPVAIVNDEGAPRKYELRASIDVGQVVQQATDQQVAVAPGATVTTPIVFTPDSPGAVYHVEIQLIGTSEQLHIVLSTSR